MNIVHLINGLGLGGTETALYRLLCSMNHQTNDTFTVIVLGGAGYYSTKIEALGIPIYYLEINKKQLIKKFYHLVLLIKKINPDVLQTWLYHADLLGGLSGKLGGVRKIIWSIRCEGVGLKKTTLGLKHVCAWLSWFIPDFIMVNSNKAADHHARAGYNRKKMRVIFNGFDSSYFSPNRKKMIDQHDLPKDAFLIGNLARFHKDKGYLNLIGSIDAICERYPKVYFILCGEGCHDKNTALNTMIATLRHSENVILIDGVDDTASYLNNLDIFVLTSITESFPNSLAEAMLCELPCIATAVGESRQILGDTGLLVPRDDTKAFTEACFSMLQKSPNERKQLGFSARNRIKARYSLMHHQSKIYELYKGDNTPCVD